MKITLKDNYALQDKMNKLSSLSKDQALKLIYEWVKKDVIDFGVFQYMTNSIYVIAMNKQPKYCAGWHPIADYQY